MTSFVAEANFVFSVALAVKFLISVGTREREKGRVRNGGRERREEKREVRGRMMVRTSWREGKREI